MTTGRINQVAIFFLQHSIICMLSTANARKAAKSWRSGKSILILSLIKEWKHSFQLWSIIIPEQNASFSSFALWIINALIAPYYPHKQRLGCFAPTKCSALSPLQAEKTARFPTLLIWFIIQSAMQKSTLNEADLPQAANGKQTQLGNEQPAPCALNASFCFTKLNSVTKDAPVALLAWIATFLYKTYQYNTNERFPSIGHFLDQLAQNCEELPIRPFSIQTFATSTDHSYLASLTNRWSFKEISAYCLQNSQRWLLNTTQSQRRERVSITA